MSAPSDAKRSATLRPMRLPAPVTSATLSDRNEGDMFRSPGIVTEHRNSFHEELLRSSAKLLRFSRLRVSIRVLRQSLPAHDKKIPTLHEIREGWGALDV